MTGERQAMPRDVGEPRKGHRTGRIPDAVSQREVQLNPNCYLFPSRTIYLLVIKAEFMWL